MIALVLDGLYQITRFKKGVSEFQKTRTWWLEGVVVGLLVVLLAVVLMSPGVLLVQLLVFTVLRGFALFVVNTDAAGTEGSKSKLEELWGRLLRYPRALILVFSGAILVPTLFISTMSMVFIPLNQVEAQIAMPVFALFLTLSLHKHLRLNLTIARLVLLAVVALLSSMHLIVYKALLPTDHKEHYGLSARSSNYAAIGGWDWSMSWLRFSASPEELETVLSNMSWTIRVDGDYQTFPMIKDSQLALPPYGKGFSGGFDPFSKITRPCEHWHVDEETHLPIDLYYDPESQTVEIFRTEEMDMDPRARY